MKNIKTKIDKQITKINQINKKWKIGSQGDPRDLPGGVSGQIKVLKTLSKIDVFWKKHQNP